MVRNNNRPLRILIAIGIVAVIAVLVGNSGGLRGPPTTNGPERQPLGSTKTERPDAEHSVGVSEHVDWIRLDTPRNGEVIRGFVVRFRGEVLLDAAGGDVLLDGIPVNMDGRSFKARRCFSTPRRVTFEFQMQDSPRSLPSLWVQVDLVRDRAHDEKLEMLIERTQAEDHARRSAACYQLGHEGDLRAVDPLLTMFHQSDDARFRCEIAWALQHLRSVDAIPALIDALQDDSVWIPAYCALRGITGQSLGQDWWYPGRPGFRDEAIRKWRAWFAENELALRSQLHQNRAD